MSQNMSLSLYFLQHFLKSYSSKIHIHKNRSNQLFVKYSPQNICNVSYLSYVNIESVIRWYETDSSSLEVMCCMTNILQKRLFSGLETFHVHISRNKLALAVSNSSWVRHMVVFKNYQFIESSSYDYCLMYINM